MHYNTTKKLDILREYIRRNYKKWQKKYPNLVGAYPGEKITSDKTTGRYSIVFLVTKKQANPSTKIPDYFEVELSKNSKKKIPTDVIKTEKFKLRSANLSDRIKRTSLTDFGANGIFVVKGNHTYACSNAHVLLPDMIKSGRTHFFRPINKQTIPDVALNNSNGERFPAYLQEGFFDGIDAAIARMDDPGQVGNRIPGAGRPTGIRIVKVSDKGLSLQMAGLISGKQRGNVTRIGITIPTGIPDAFLHDLIEVSIFSQRGDSGSPVFNSALSIVGILLGGTSTTSLIVPIDRIMEFFQCDLLI